MPLSGAISQENFWKTREKPRIDGIRKTAPNGRFSFILQKAYNSALPGKLTNYTNMLTNWLISALAIFVTALILPGIRVGVVSALVTAVVLGLLNAFIKPIIVILTLPVNIVTLGLFTFVINAVIILLAGAIVPGFQVSGFWSALLFSIVLSFVSMLFA